MVQNIGRQIAEGMNRLELMRSTTAKTPEMARIWMTGVASSHFAPNPIETSGAAMAEMPMLAGKAMTSMEEAMRM